MVQGVFHCIGVKSLVSRTRSRQSSVRRLGFCQQMQSMWLLIACSCCSTVQRFDPFYSATILHFQDLLKRFGSPIIVLNLIKVRGCALLSRAHVCVASHGWIPSNVYFVCVCVRIQEKEATPRESILRREFKIAVQQINNQLPPELHIHYIAFDFHRAAKSKGADVIDIMASIAEEPLKLTGFFHAGPRVYSNLLHRVRTKLVGADARRH